MNIQTNPLFRASDEIYEGTIIHGKQMTEYDIENPILVFPNGNVEFYETIVYTLRKNKKLVVVVEKGGPNCHLLINAREKQNLSVLHLPFALQKLSNNSKASINLKNSVITL